MINGRAYYCQYHVLLSTQTEEHDRVDLGMKLLVHIGKHLLPNNYYSLKVTLAHS